MKSRVLSLALVSILLVSLFAGCAATNAPEDTTEATLNTEATTTELTETTTEETTEQTTEPETEATTQAPETTAEPTRATQAATKPTAAPTSAPTTAPAATEAPEPTQPVDLRATAMNYIGQSVSSLYAAIGYPNGSSYASSCNGPGEDGELYYNGFTVYTYRENGVETVVDVW